VNATALAGRVEVVADEDGLTSRAGTALLVGVADRVGLTGALGEAMSGVRERASRHCPGRALRDVAVMLADGGDALCDVRVLRDEPSQFGPVASDRSLASPCSATPTCLRNSAPQRPNLATRMHRVGVPMRCASRPAEPGRQALVSPPARTHRQRAGRDWPLTDLKLSSDWREVRT
jgi:hypothetical protein